MKTFPSLLFATLAMFALGAAAKAQPVLRFAGSSAFAKIIQPLAVEVGNAHQTKIELLPNSPGRGLEALVAGKADALLAAGPLQLFVNQVNEKRPGAVDPAKLKVFDVSQEPLVVIAHPSNPVATLTFAQIQGLFGGSIKNWKEVGGPDAPVVVVLPAATTGVRAVLTEKIMSGVAYISSARVLPLPSDAAKAVAQIPGAIGFLGKESVIPGLKVIAPSQPIGLPYAFITVGEPTEPLKSVIADLQLRLK